MSPYDGSREPGGGGPGRSPAAPCPICRKPLVAEHKPFCSERCRQVDLHRWLGGVYRVPTNEAPDEDEAAPPPKRAEE